MIEISNISKSYAGVKAVDNLSFTANAGSITTLLGGNGSGKTTTLRLISGIIAPDANSNSNTEKSCIKLCNLDIQTNTIAARKNLGIFPDQFGLYPRLTTIEHLEFFGKLHGLRKQKLKDAIERTVDILAINDIAHRRTSGFSQGQRMKVALARAFIHAPKIMVLDEPTRGLDIISVRLLRQLLKDLRDKGICILMSCHVMAEVEELSDQLIFIAKGQKRASGTPKELIENINASNLEEAFIQYIGRS